MPVEQFFTLNHPDAEEEQQWVLNRAQAEELCRDLMETLGWNRQEMDGLDTAALEDLIRNVLVDAEYEPEVGEEEYNDWEIGVDVPLGIPDSETVTIPVEQMEKALAAKQVAARQDAPVHASGRRGGMNAGSGIGSGKPNGR